LLNRVRRVASAGISLQAADRWSRFDAVEGRLRSLASISSCGGGTCGSLALRELNILAWLEKPRKVPTVSDPALGLDAAEQGTPKSVPSLTVEVGIQWMKP
jgi:hypothetical protein